MKTVIQELIDEVVEHLTYDDGLSEDNRVTYETIRLRLIGKLEKEKEQIINAHEQGWSDAYDYYITEADSYSCAPIQADDYYNETYQNK